MYTVNSELSEHENRALSWLDERRRSGLGSPSYREIAGHLGFGSPRAATKLVRRLEGKGLIKCDPKIARGIHLAAPLHELPVVGWISAGFPIDVAAMDDPAESLDIDPHVFGIRHRDHAMALRVTGDSMEGRQIFDRDLVVLEREVEPRHLDIVAALIDQQSTLKTLVRKRGAWWLQAENPRYPERTPRENLQIQGVVRAVIRWIKP